MTEKKYWRCNVCNDIHYGMAGPGTCPTCGAVNAYVEIDQKEAANVLELKVSDAKGTDSKDLLSSWESFTEKNDFVLNPDKWHIETVAKGVLENEKKFGLKLCPCRLRDKTRARDLELICPCNFKAQDTWKDKGMCWCGLFVKK